MSQCGSIEFLSGGAIQGSTIIQSDITSSTVTASTITASTIENLAGIDTSSAQRIVEAICQLDETTLQKLADALGLKLDSGSAPASTTEDNLSTKVYGNRDALLGEPSEWIVLDGKTLPAYGG